MLSDSVKLEILSQYGAFTREKNAFESTFRSFIERLNLGQFDAALFADACRAYHALYSAAEQLATTILAYVPWSFIDFKPLLGDDFRELLRFHAGYAKALRDFGERYSASGAPLPQAHEYESFRVIAALASTPEERASYINEANPLGMGTWDIRRIEELEQTVAESTQPIPEGVDFSDPDYQRLKNAFIIQRRPFAVIIGSGGSISVTSWGLPDGLPDWRGLTEELLRAASKQGKWKEDKVERYARQIDAGQVIDVLQNCKRALSDYWTEELEKFFAWSVVEPKLRDISLYRNIAALPFHARLTTNYDSAYERINNVDSISVLGFRRALFRWPKGQWREKIVKIHGNVDTGDPLILSADDYIGLYTNLQWEEDFSQLFKSYQVLFVGFGTSDNWFNHFLAKVARHTRGAAPEHLHYIITEELDENEVERLRNNYGIHPIMFPSGRFEWVRWYIQDLLVSYQRLQIGLPNSGGVVGVGARVSGLTPSMPALEMRKAITETPSSPPEAPERERLIALELARDSLARQLWPARASGYALLSDKAKQGEREILTLLDEKWGGNIGPVEPRDRESIIGIWDLLAYRVSPYDQALGRAKASLLLDYIYSDGRQDAVTINAVQGFLSDSLSRDQSWTLALLINKAISDPLEQQSRKALDVVMHLVRRTATQSSPPLAPNDCECVARFFEHFKSLVSESSDLKIIGDWISGS